MTNLKMKEKIEIELVCQNRKARYEYHILSTLECGIALTGSEIKSVREHKVSLDGSYATIIDGSIWLINTKIDAYSNATDQQDPKRKRLLLLHKQEIKKFAQKAQEKGHTLVPLKVYIKGGRAKVELAVCRGKQLHDKRQTSKERESRKEIRKFS
jgi:SsrA-binding protein